MTLITEPQILQKVWLVFISVLDPYKHAINYSSVDFVST